MGLQPGSAPVTPATAPSNSPIAQGYTYDAQGNLVDKNGTVILTADKVKAAQGLYGMQPGNGGSTILDKIANNPFVKAGVTATTAPLVGGATALSDAYNGQYGQIPGDLGYGATGGVVGNNKGPATGSFITPQTVSQAVDATGKVINQAGTDVATGAKDVASGGTPAPTPQTNPGADVRAQQLAYAQQLQSVINGTAGPSAADIQGHEAQDRAIAQQFAAAQGATGAQQALAYRQALQNAAQISQQAGADAATQRANETTAAENQLGTTLNNTRSSDLTQYGTDVGAGNVRYAADKDFQGKKIAAGAGVLSGGIGALISDENEKSGKAPADGEIADMLDKLKAMKFRYKDPAGPGKAPGKRAGVMAQDLERSMAGKALVVETPEGKGIDTPQAVGAMLAALASLHARTKRLEGR